MKLIQEQQDHVLKLFPSELRFIIASYLSIVDILSITSTSKTFRKYLSGYSLDHYRVKNIIDKEFVAWSEKSGVRHNRFNFSFQPWHEPYDIISLVCILNTSRLVYTTKFHYLCVIDDLQHPEVTRCSAQQFEHFTNLLPLKVEDVVATTASDTITIWNLGDVIEKMFILTTDEWTLHVLFQENMFCQGHGDYELISGHMNGSVCLWDFHESHKCVNVFRGERHRMASLITLDNGLVVTSYIHGLTLILDMSKLFGETLICFELDVANFSRGSYLCFNAMCAISGDGFIVEANNSLFTFKLVRGNVSSASCGAYKGCCKAAEHLDFYYYIQKWKDIYARNEKKSSRLVRLHDGEVISWRQDDILLWNILDMIPTEDGNNPSMPIRPILNLDPKELH